MKFPQSTLCKFSFFPVTLHHNPPTDTCRHAYPQDGQEESVREGFDPHAPKQHNPEQAHNLDSPFAVGDNEEENNNDREPLVSEEALTWNTRDYGKNDEEADDGDKGNSPSYGSFREERNAWGDHN